MHFISKMLLITKLLFLPILMNIALASKCEKIEYYCGGVLTEKNGTISSPSFPEMAPPHTLCKWEINIPFTFSRSKVILNFTNFQVQEWDMECRYNYVEIEGEKRNNDIHKYGKFCESKSPDVITFEGDSLSIEFRTIGYGGSAFEATYKIECSEFTCDSGDCIRFESICSTQDVSGYCTHRGERPVCTEEICLLGGGFYCDGKCLPKRSICDLEYDCIDHSDEKDCDYCGGVITETNGTITSPNYPSDYPPNSRCKWIFNLKPNTKLEVKFKRFSLDPPKLAEPRCRDYVAIGEIKNYDPDFSPVRHCASRPSRTIVRNGIFILIFKSDGINESPYGLGFKAKYLIECEGVTCDDSKCISQEEVCNGHQDCDDNFDEENCNNQTV